MNWKVLGIEPTKDKNEIKKAYRSLLKSVNPEDKPEEFKELREAYEEAMELADKEDVPDSEKSEIELWSEKANAIYDDYKKRIDVGSWRELLSEDVCIAIDTRQDIEDALLRMLMEKFRIPQRVWKYLDTEFQFSDRAEDLYEKYPKDFVDYAVINGIRLEDDVDYDLFTPGDDGYIIDKYLSIFYKLNKMPYEEMDEAEKELLELSERHPYGDTLLLRKYVIISEDESKAEKFKEYLDKYPEDLHILMDAVYTYLHFENFEKVEELCNKILELCPEHNSAKFNLAKALAGQKKYEEAVELINELMQAAGGDNKKLHFLNDARTQWNEALIEQYKEYIAEHPEDDVKKTDFAWCYLQNFKNEEALEVCKTINPDNVEPFVYYNLVSQTYVAVNMMEEALEANTKLIEIIKTLEPDGTAKRDRQINRLSEKIAFNGDILYSLERKEEAITYFEQAVLLKPDDPELLTHMSHAYFVLKDFEKAADYAFHLTEVLPDSYHGYLLLADALYEMHNDRNAFEAVNKAMSIDATDIAEYILKCLILLRNNSFEGAKDIINLLENSDLGDDTTVIFCKGRYADETDDLDAAIENYKKVIERFEGGEFFRWPVELYYRYADKLIAKNGSDTTEKRNELIAILEKGLEKDPEDFDCLNFKAWLIKSEGNVPAAVEIFKQLEARPRTNHYIERQLAETYYKDLKTYAPEALHYYEIVLSDDDREPNTLFYTAMCYFSVGNLQKAEELFLREMEVEPDVMDAYYRLGFIYESMNRNEDALEMADKTLKIVTKEEGDHSHYYLRKAQILKRLGRPEEAIEAIWETINTYNRIASYDLIFNTYLQFAMFKEAEFFCDAHWKRVKSEFGNYQYAKTLLHIYNENMLKAKLSRSNWGIAVSQENKEKYDEIMAIRNGKAKVLESNWLKKLEGVDESNCTYLSYVYIKLSESQMYGGSMEKAREYANKGIIYADRALSQYSKFKALYATRKALFLAFLGDKDGAYETLELARALPLCENCDYCKCKDADLYEAYIAYILGDSKHSMELCEKFIQIWPDELDLANHLHYLKKKGK